MDRDKIHDIPGFPAVGGSRCFIGGEVNGIQHIAEEIVPACGEEAKTAVGYPFQQHFVAGTLDLSITFIIRDLFP